MSNRCGHGWPLRGDMECPECLWEGSLGASNPVKRRADLDNIKRAVTTAAACLPTHAEQREILTIAREESNWHAIREAKRRLGL